MVITNNGRPAAILAAVKESNLEEAFSAFRQALAVAGHAVCLVTGNQTHFPPNRCQEVTVLSPTDFLAFYRTQLTTTR
jgi:hypothetical protein